MTAADSELDAAPADEAADCCVPSRRGLLPAAEAERLSMMFKAMGDPTRVQVVRLLADVAELCVCDINVNFPLEPSTMSHHLRVLREAGFITSRRRGLWVFYRLEPGAEATVRRMLGPATDRAAAGSAR